MINFRSSLLRMRNIRDKGCRENQNTRSVFANFFFPENPAVYDVMWKNMVESVSPHVII